VPNDQVLRGHNFSPHGNVNFIGKGNVKQHQEDMKDLVREAVEVEETVTSTDDQSRREDRRPERERSISLGAGPTPPYRTTSTVYAHLFIHRENKIPKLVINRVFLHINFDPLCCHIIFIFSNI